MNQDRIKRAQKEIETMLPAHEQYVVTTSEFVEIRTHLQELKGERPQLHIGASSQKGNGPVLHRREPDGSVPVDGDDGRPKLQQRP